MLALRSCGMDMTRTFTLLPKSDPTICKEELGEAYTCQLAAPSLILNVAV